MKNFKTIAVLVLAEQWLGMEEQTERLLAENVIMKSSARDGSILVPTLGGNLTCRLNDYIVTDAKGSRSVVDAETFEASYELDEATYLKVVDENVKANPNPVKYSEETNANEVVSEDANQDAAKEIEVVDEAPKTETKAKK